LRDVWYGVTGQQRQSAMSSFLWDARLSEVPSSAKISDLLRFAAGLPGAKQRGKLRHALTYDPGDYRGQTSRSRRIRQTE
jgi:hypothetical protein